MQRGSLLFAAVLAGACLGAAAGLGAFTFVYARGASYLSNDPSACANCHIMQAHFDAWAGSSHRNVAVCNDCHAPHTLLGKYRTKALNGIHHSMAFTRGEYHQPIRITLQNHRIAEQACRRCHAQIVEAIDPAAAAGQETTCSRCHRSVGHWH